MLCPDDRTPLAAAAPPCETPPARYARPSASSAKRVIGCDKRGNILLRWTSGSTGKTAVLALYPHEFIRRWLLHVLPKGLTKVSDYGYLASAARNTRLRVRALLGESGEPAPVHTRQPLHPDNLGSLNNR